MWNGTRSLLPADGSGGVGMIIGLYVPATENFSAGLSKPEQWTVPFQPSEEREIWFAGYLPRTCTDAT